MYNVKSLKAEEFISDEEIKETLEYAEANKNNIGLIDKIIEKAKLKKGLTHREASVLLACEIPEKLDEVYITVNKNAIPNDPEKPFVTSGVRVGTAAVTTRGLVEEDMDVIAECMYLTATDFENKADEIREKVNAICKKYPLYE